MDESSRGMVLEYAPNRGNGGGDADPTRVGTPGNHQRHVSWGVHLALEGIMDWIPKVFFTLSTLGIVGMLLYGMGLMLRGIWLGG